MQKTNMHSHCSNNFEKIKDISSELLWENNISCLKNDVFLSILIVTYKRMNMLQEAIGSVKKQLPVEYLWEVVIVDNDPASIGLEKTDFEDLNVPVRYYRNEKNVGHAGNLNRGVELCKGKWVSFLHDDDLIVESYLKDIEKYIKKAEKWKKPLAYLRTKHAVFGDLSQLPICNGITVDHDVKWFRGEKQIETLLRGCGPTYVNSCGSLVRRDAFIKIGGYNDDYYPIGDAILGIVLANRGYSIAFTETVMGYYRMDGNESAKVSGIIDLTRADFELREFLYKRNLLTYCFGTVFRGAQFTNSVDVKLKISKAKLEEKDWREINAIYLYKNRNFRVNLLKVLVVAVSGILHPNTIINRLIEKTLYGKGNLIYEKTRF